MSLQNLKQYREEKKISTVDHDTPVRVVCALLGAQRAHLPHWPARIERAGSDEEAS